MYCKWSIPEADPFALSICKLMILNQGMFGVQCNILKFILGSSGGLMWKGGVQTNLSVNLV